MKIPALIAFITLLTGAVLWSQEGNLIILKAPSSSHFHADVALTTHGQFTGELAGALGGIKRAAFILINDSDKAITGIAIRYVITDVDKQEKAYRYFTDSYMTGSFRQVLGPHAEMLIGPSVFLPGTLASKGHVGSTATRDLIELVGRALIIEAQIDVAIYQDGEIIGPDSLQLSQDITARYVAAQQVAHQLTAAQANGQSMKAALDRFRTARTEKGDLISMWARRFAEQSLRGMPPETMIANLAEMQHPPVFYSGKN